MATVLPDSMKKADPEQKDTAIEGRL